LIHIIKKYLLIVRTRKKFTISERIPIQSKTLVLMPCQFNNILLQIFLFIADIIDKKFRVGSSSFNSNKILIFWVNSCLHNLAGLRYSNFRRDSLYTHRPYISVGGKFLLRRIISIVAVVSESIASGHPNIEHNDSILGEGVSADDNIIYLPIILKVMLGKPVDGLGASGEGVGLYQVVEEGRMFFPYFIRLVDGDKVVLIVLH